jgi:hypothetical protein
MPPELVIGPTQRVLILGRTQSGKSTLARALFYGVSRLVVIDQKWEEQLARGVTVYSPDEFRQTYPQRSTRVVFRPDPTAKRAADVGEVIARVLAHRRCRLVVHEAVDYATPNWIEPNLRRAIKTGAYLEVGVTICSQRPIGLHNDAISETEHVFVFDLAMPGDRDKLAELGVPELLQRAGGGYGFLYYGPSTGGRAIRCSPIIPPAGPAPPAASEQTGGDAWSGRRSATS